ncbi:hypothetical protein KI387_011082, partial [Taxus chinensis]
MDIDELPKCDANYTALTPLWFLQRAAQVHPKRKSIIHGSKQYTWDQTYDRCRRLASALARLSIAAGTTVAVLAPNVPATYEAHFGVPMAGAVVNCVNIRLDARIVAFLLEHSKAAAVLVDQDFFPLLQDALRLIREKRGTSGFRDPVLVVIEDEACDKGNLERALKMGAVKYEDFLAGGDPGFEWRAPEDEWQSMALGYTSGTTSNPKGVVLSHRGAYLGSLGASLAWDMADGCVYLWTLPMFHCNGWCFTWAMAAFCGTSICLRQVTAKGIFSAIAEHKVTHFCAAPIVLNTIVNAAAEDRVPIPPGVHVMTAGAAPPASVLSLMEEQGFRVTHTYGLSETYGPSTVCAWKDEWNALPLPRRAALKSRQGVRYLSLEGLEVVNPDTMAPVPADGSSVGEVVMRGNMVMKGYLHNPEANRESFKGGWFHSGDLAVKHPDGYIEIKDRAKDIIISGGENISSLEVENAIYGHPLVLEASVVARPDERWGESPCAFITLKKPPSPAPCGNGDEPALAEDIMKYCRARLPGYMVPKSVVFGPLPKTATGKIQKHTLRAKVKEMGPV